MNPRVTVIALVIAAGFHLLTGIDETRAPPAVETATVLPTAAPVVKALPTKAVSGRLPTAAPAVFMPAFVATTPFAAIEVASLPRRQATETALPAPTPTVTPVDERIDCDPAYPDEDTCIPPGPPFDQGCAITEERRFTVLPPDPQRLDHDKDGIGCEPVR